MLPMAITAATHRVLIILARPFTAALEDTKAVSVGISCENLSPPSTRFKSMLSLSPFSHLRRREAVVLEWHSIEIG